MAPMVWGDSAAWKLGVGVVLGLAAALGAWALWRRHERMDRRQRLGVGAGIALFGIGALAVVLKPSVDRVIVTENGVACHSWKREVAWHDIESLGYAPGIWWLPRSRDWMVVRLSRAEIDRGHWNFYVTARGEVNCDLRHASAPSEEVFRAVHAAWQQRRRGR